MKIDKEKVDTKLFEELEPLFHKHYRETGVYLKDLEIDKIRYIQGDAVGLFAAYSIRDEGTIVGYVGYWISPSPHIASYIAQQDVLYIDKKYREGRTAVKLLNYAEEKLKEDFEVDLIIQFSSIEKDISALFNYLGYRETGRVFHKEV